MSDLRYSEKWNGEYRGIRFEIIKWQISVGSDKYIWNYYLCVNEKQFPEDVRADYVLLPLEPTKEFPKWVCYEYEKSVWSNIEAHCGWTFYEILGGEVGTPKTVKIGCDYSHYWDEGCRYNEDIILSEVKESIDQLHDAVNLVEYDPKTGEFIETVENEDK